MTEVKRISTDSDVQDPAGLARLIADYAADKKAIDIAELDLRGVLGYTDFLVICTARHERLA